MHKHLVSLLPVRLQQTSLLGLALTLPLLMNCSSAGENDDAKGGTGGVITTGGSVSFGGSTGVSAGGFAPVTGGSFSSGSTLGTGGVFSTGGTTVGKAGASAGGTNAGGASTAQGGRIPSGGVSAQAGIGGIPGAGPDGNSPYQRECHGETAMCVDVASLRCLGIRDGTSVAGYSCSNPCQTDADCSKVASSAQAAPACIDFVSQKHCLLLCLQAGKSYSCPTGMGCYVYAGSTTGYCLWQ